MYRKLRLCIFTILIFIQCLFSGTTTLARTYHSILRVGIYYGSGAVESIDFDSNSGFAVGYSADRSFYYFTTLTNLLTTVTKSPAGTHHILYSSHNSAAEMNEALASLKSSGIPVFPAYYDSSYCVFGGIFKTAEEAMAEIEKQTTKGTPVAVSSNALCMKDRVTDKLLFVSDSNVHGLAVYSADRYNTDALLTISGNAKGTYRGGFECRADSNGLTLTNIVPVESYLYSVVCREMSPSWHTEALKVQAVCARNFALSRIDYHSKYGFDVCRTTCCQAYSTTADQTENVHEAVDSTYGEMLFYDDVPVQAVYSSSMGAATENVEYVWGTTFPYLVSVENPYEDTENIYNGKWTKRLTKERATEIMSSKGFDIGDVTDIRVVERTPSGSVLKLCVTGTKGEKIFERESCRTTFSEATYSQRYTVTSGGITTYPTVSILSKDKTVSKTMNTASVLNGNNKTQTISGNFSATNGTSAKKYSAVTTDGDPNTFIFSGEGWGHGVGMSQYGAKGMAEAGFAYEDILTHYYTGTYLKKAY